ncbi:WecB/TagA/CpsF family glycosyltransferase [Aurantimonas sp. VKM B-3413]|uniref:WecB/TagA/CpsF family glycosyltransferase n=1 Tax=Aurantimonas sp. VKM B-3413 TaxID=2779401 RepID=UPI001E2D652A|nr:WecB/TagA/CpsF family glycosyltransferase [Aurantimonas sp. VKM B-3413]MCB8839597.1 WecB/TagA/CpsF family glycosyltransferase [Aurantimonas sp. VKM B-3413]
MRPEILSNLAVVPRLRQSERTQAIAGIEVTDAAGTTVIADLAAALAAGRTTRLAFLNAHCVNVARNDPAYHAALRRFLVLPDGIGVDLAGRILHGRPFTENLNGTDFVPRLLAALAPYRLRVALIGAAPGVAERAAERLAVDIPGHTFLAVSDGYFGADHRPEVLKKLAAAKADIVIVALGVPGQERFIAEHLTPEHGRLFIGVGALLDFLAGEVQRAPRLVRAVRAEWVWRLSLEPARLWRRYILGNPIFLAAILRDRYVRSHNH